MKKPLQCKICGRLFRSKDGLLAHVQAQHVSFAPTPTSRPTAKSPTTSSLGATTSAGSARQPPSPIAQTRLTGKRTTSFSPPKTDLSSVSGSSAKGPLLPTAQTRSKSPFLATVQAKSIPHVSPLLKSNSSTPTLENSSAQRTSMKSAKTGSLRSASTTPVTDTKASNNSPSTIKSDTASDSPRLGSLTTPEAEILTPKSSQICKIAFGSQIQVAAEQLEPSIAFPSHPFVALKCEEILNHLLEIKTDNLEPEEQTELDNPLMIPDPIIEPSTFEAANVKPEPTLFIVDIKKILGKRNQPTQNFQSVESTEQTIVEVENDVTLDNIDVTFGNDEVTLGNDGVTLSNNDVTLDNNDDVIQINDSDEDVVQFVTSVKVDKAKVEQVKKQKLQERQNKFKSRLKAKTKADCQCKVCGKQYCSPAALKQHKRHTRALSQPDKPFQCQLCSKMFAKKQTLDRHTIDTHERRKPCYCKHCGKTFRAKYFLNIHTLEEHPNDDIIID